jgi:hypothetical protein
MTKIKKKYLLLVLAILLGISVSAGVLLFNWGCAKKLQEKLAEQLPVLKLEVGDWVKYKVTNTAEQRSFSETLLVFAAEQIEGERAYWIRQTQEDDLGHQQVREFLVQPPAAVGKPYRVIRLIEYSWGRSWEDEGGELSKFNGGNSDQGGAIDLLLGNLCVFPAAQGDKDSQIGDGSFAYSCLYGSQTVNFQVDNTIPIIRFSSSEISPFQLTVLDSGHLPSDRIAQNPKKQPLEYEVKNGLDVAGYHIWVGGFRLLPGQKTDQSGESEIQDELIVDLEVKNERTDSWVFSRRLLFRIEGSGFDPVIPDELGSPGEIKDKMLKPGASLDGLVTFYLPTGAAQANLVADFAVFDLGKAEVPLIYDPFNYPPMLAK